MGGTILKHRQNGVVPELQHGPDGPCYFNGSAAPMYLADERGYIVRVNPALRALLGPRADTVLGARALPGDGAVRPAVTATLIGFLDGFVTDTTIATPAGTLLVEARGITVQDPAGGRRILVVLTEKEPGTRAHTDDADHDFQAMLEQAQGVFFYVRTLSGTFTYVSPAIADVLGYTPAEAVGDVVPWTSPNTAATPQPGGEPRPAVFSTMARHSNGRLTQLEIIEELSAPKSRRAVVRGFARDVTDRVDAQRALRVASLSDPLTGLANRVYLLERLERTLASLRSDSARQACLLCIDIDRFTIVNDSLGQPVGDQMLVEAGSRLQRLLRADDVLARTGNDEFVVLLDHSTAPLAAALASRINQAFTIPFQVGEHEIFTSVSVGIITVDGTAECVDEVVRGANIAMHHAKASPTTPYAVFDRTMHTQVLERLTLETDLRRALDRSEFEINYQPVINLGTGAITSLEALIRWKHPLRGRMLPLEFIYLAEQTGLIIPIGYWVIRTACTQLAALNNAPGESARVAIAVNLSSKQFADPRLVPTICEILAESGADPTLLTLELTESVLADNLTASAATLDALRSLGIRIYMDDFGTGYSSLSYLHALPIDALKIDRSFVHQMQSSRKHYQLVCAILSLASTLDIQVVAEGVDHSDQLTILRDLGCEFGQGHLFSPAIGTKDALKMLALNPTW